MRKIWKISIIVLAILLGIFLVLCGLDTYEKYRETNQMVERDKAQMQRILSALKSYEWNESSFSNVVTVLQELHGEHILYSPNTCSMCISRPHFRIECLDPSPVKIQSFRIISEYLSYPQPQKLILENDGTFKTQ